MYIQLMRQHHFRLRLRQLNTGVAENPGTFAKDVSAAWRAQTIMIHPASFQTFFQTLSALTTALGDMTRKIGQLTIGAKSILEISKSKIQVKINDKVYLDI